MKKPIVRLFAGIGALWVASSQAGPVTPANIAFAKEAQNSQGETYKTYQVSCSDQSQHVISYWDHSKQWCVGTQSERCSRDRITAATLACRR
jgi:hypothetical protein